MVRPTHTVRGRGRGLRWLTSHGVRSGCSVAVLGPDGAGKSTLVAALAAAFPVPTEVVYFGLWSGESGAVARPLPAAMVAAGRRLVRSWGRALVTRGHLARGRLVILDRHPYDALLPPAPPHVRLKRVFFALLAHMAPTPTLTLVLDVPAEVAARRRPEEDPAALAVAGPEYLALAGRLPRAVVLDADQPPEVVRAAAVEQVWRMLAVQRQRTARGRRARPVSEGEGLLVQVPPGQADLPQGAAHGVGQPW